MLRPRGQGSSGNALSVTSSGPAEPDTPTTHYVEKLGSREEKVHAPNMSGVHEHMGANHGHESRRPGAGGPRGLVARLVAGLRGGRGRKGGRFGLSQRAWLVLTLIVGLIFLTKVVFSPDPQNLQPSDFAEMTPRDYLNSSITDPAPFDFCPVFGPGDPIAARRGQFELLRSRLHTGTGGRVQRVLRKAMAGMPVTISVLGGSVSACQGAGDDPIAPECYPARFFNWWNTVFPHPNNELTNGALKKTDSAYFAFCSTQHLPDKTDLVILEFDSSDPNDPNWLTHFELLVRSVLLRPEQPAVLILGHFSPQVQAQNGFAGPELLHNAVAQFYDVPHITAKGVMYESYLEDPHRALEELYTDSQLANKEGHDLIADVLISYFMGQICSGWSTLLGHQYSVPAASTLKGGRGGVPLPLGGIGLRPGQVPDQSEDDGATEASLLNHAGDHSLETPPMRIQDRPFHMERFREVEPYCVSAGDLVQPLPKSIFYGSGWSTYHPPKNAVNEDRHYWYADQPTSSLRVPIRVGSGDIGIYYLQQPMDKRAGNVLCWVDDNLGGSKKLFGNADVEETIATLTLIDVGVSQGSHFVTCAIEGEAGSARAPFKIIGIFST